MEHYVAEDSDLDPLDHLRGLLQLNVHEAVAEDQVAKVLSPPPGHHFDWTWRLTVKTGQHSSDWRFVHGDLAIKLCNCYLKLIQSGLSS